MAQHCDKLDKLAKALCEHEVLDEHEIEALIGPSIHRSETKGQVDISPSGTVPVTSSADAKA